MAPIKGGFAPNLDKFLDSLKSRPVDASVEHLISLIKRRQIQGSEACAIATARVLLQVVARDKWSDVDQLVGRIQLVGRKLVAAQPRELVIGNVVRRVLGLIRDEASEDRNEPSGDTLSELHEAQSSVPPSPISKSAPRPAVFVSLNSRTQSMYNLLSDPDSNPTSLLSGISTPGLGSGASTPLGQAQSSNVHALKSEIIDGIEEIMDEIKLVDEQVQAYSEIVIHPGDYILVHQPSRTVQKFLAKAASKRRFTVFLVVDPSASSTDEDLYASLRKSITSNGSTLVTVMNTGLMAYMSRVNKVILGARAITGKGGVLVDSGAAVIARAAHEMGRSVIVLAGVYKLSPESQFNQEAIIEWGDPSKYVNFSDGAMVKHVRVRNAVSEFVPADLVDTYITNLGAHSRDHLHGIISDHYKEEDLNFDFWGKVQR